MTELEIAEAAEKTAVESWHEHKKKAADFEKQALEAKVRIFGLKYGIKPGVVARMDRTGELFKIATVRASFGHPQPWVTGHPKKEDGTWSKTAFTIYGDYTAVQSPS